MTTKIARANAAEGLADLAQELEVDARRSLSAAAMYAAAKGHPRAEQAVDLVLEQDQLLDRITAAGLIPFSPSDPAAVRRDWLDSAIDRMDRYASPLLARYGDLHDRRIEFVEPHH